MIKRLSNLLTKDLRYEIRGLADRVYRAERRLSEIQKEGKRMIYRDELQPGQIIWTEDRYSRELFGPYRVDKVLPSGTIRASCTIETDNRFEVSSEWIWTAK